MKIIITFFLLLTSTEAHKLSQKRIAETEEPFLIPSVMATDRATKWATCNGTNTGRCREAEPFLEKSDVVPQAQDYVHGDAVSKGLLKF